MKTQVKRLIPAQRCKDEGLDFIEVSTVKRVVQRRLFKAALDELAIIGEPVNRVLEVDLDAEEVTLTLYDLPPA
jgi:hypothetical protein